MLRSPALQPLLQLPLSEPRLRPRQHAWCVQQLIDLVEGPRAVPLLGLDRALSRTFAELSLEDLEGPDSWSDSLLRLPPTPESLRQPLDSVGSAHVPWELWQALGLPRRLPPHPPQRRSSPAALPMLHTLAGQGLLVPCEAAAGSPAFALFKSASSARLIVNCKVFNGVFPDPPPFRLPTFSHLLCRPLCGLYFIKLDVANFFWSLQLPGEVEGGFILESGGRYFFSRRLPFGWKWSPLLAQSTLGRILTPISSVVDGLLWQFYDDVLLGGYDPCFLCAVGAYAVHILSAHALFINKKSVLVPTQRITWLGKVLDSAEGSIVPHPKSLARGFLLLWSLRCSGLSFRGLQRFLGFMQWLQSPASSAGPFMATAYAMLRSSFLPRLLPRAVWRSLLQALLFAMLPVRARSPPPPLCMPLVFCDAAPCAASFLVGVWRHTSFGSVTQVPSWVRSVQDAEMYAVFHAIRQIIHRKLSSVCVVTDNAGVFFSVSSGRVSASHPARLRLLRRINRLCLQHQLQLQLALVPSHANPADPLSRIFDFSPNLVGPVAQSKYSLPALYGFTTAIHRFWWRY